MNIFMYNFDRNPIYSDLYILAGDGNVLIIL